MARVGSKTIKEGNKGHACPTWWNALYFDTLWDINPKFLTYLNISLYNHTTRKNIHEEGKKTPL